MKKIRYISRGYFKDGSLSNCFTSDCIRHLRTSEKPILFGTAGDKISAERAVKILLHDMEVVVIKEDDDCIRMSTGRYAHDKDGKICTI